MLDGKCKEAFENTWGIGFTDNQSDLDGFKLIDFYKLPFSMQWGVYLEFFDSVGIVISVSDYIVKDVHINWTFNVAMFNNDVCRQRPYGHPDSRQQAQTESIKKANEIFNNENT